MRQHNAVYFWQPARGDKGDMLRVMRLDERLPSLAVIAQANWSPDSRKLAYLIPSGGYTHLVISDPQAQSEVGYVLKPLLDARLTWSADNRFLALQYFEAPYWRMNIYDLSARSDGVMYDVGGVVPSDMPSLRNGRPALAWSRDGRTLAFVREIGIGRFALSAFGLGTGRYMNLLSDVKGDMLVSPRGRIAVVMHTPNGKLNFAVIDADGQNLRYLAQEVDAINDAQWRGDETLLYSTTRGEAKSLYLVNGDVQTALAEGITNYGLVRGLGVVRFKWDAPDGAHGYRIQDLDGDLRADYRTMSSVVPDRPVYPAPDGNLAAFYVISPKALGVQVASADGRYTSPLLADNVGPGLFGNLAWSPDSRHVALVYFVSGTQGQQIMEIFSAEGQRLRTVDEFKQYYDILEWTRCD
jgi:Tol biopolymer transport system component